MPKALNIEDADTLKELCKRISRFAEKHPEEVDVFEEYAEGFRRPRGKPRLAVSIPTNIEFRMPIATDMAFPYEMKTINQIRK